MANRQPNANGTGEIATLPDLEARIGRTPPAMHLKVIDHLDAMACRWIEASRVLFAAFSDGLDIRMTPALTDGIVAEPQALRLPVSSFDDPALVQPGAAFGSLFLIPGIRETLRVNGHVAHMQDGTVRIVVHECYAHCAKALIRSELWSAVPDPTPQADLARFVAQSRFMTFATMDDRHRADVSPKGDPTGMLARLIDGEICFAERPGNRRADSLRNVLAQPNVALTLLIPGSPWILRATGRARISVSEALRAAFAVSGKTPTVVTRIGDLKTEFGESAALRNAGLWPAGPAPDHIKPADVFVAHVKLNKHRGLGATLASTVISIPGLMQKGLDKDYDNNLY